MIHSNTYPNFFIVGAAKCGTSSLFYYLDQHPDICMADEKHAVEPAFFADHTGVSNMEDYLDLFSHYKSEKMVGEKSTAYLYDKNTAGRIHKFNPAAKIIIMLRNPLDMAYSLFNHNRRAGLEPIEQFNDALIAEETRVNDPGFRHSAMGYYANFFYKRRGLFFTQLKRYYDVFDPDQILTVQLNDLRAKPAEVYRTVLRFLGVETAFTANLEKMNKGGVLRIPWLEPIYSQSGPIRRGLQFLLPDKTRKAVWRWNRSSRPYPLLTINDRTKYSIFFKPEISKLHKVFGIDISES